MNRRRTKPIDSERAATVRRWFGPDAAASGFPAGRANDPIARQACCISPGRLVLITGPSGAGKSALLRRIRRRTPANQVVDLSHMRPGRSAPVDLFPDMPLPEALRLLSATALADARVWLTPAHRLSAGQRWRLRLAMALAHAEYKGPGPAFLFADDFAAGLDCITACVVARVVRRAIDDRFYLGAVIATAREDLTEPLSPDVVAQCDFGRTAVERRTGI